MRRLTLYLDDEVKDGLLEWAHQEGRDYRWLANVILREALEKRANIQPTTLEARLERIERLLRDKGLDE